MKILCSDFDGTLYLNGIISADVVKAIAKFQAQGNLFGVVTGRGLSSLNNHLSKYDIKPDFLILSNGALYIKDNQRIINGQIKWDLVEKLKLIADKHKIQMMAVCDGDKHETLATKQRLSLIAYLMRHASSLYLNSTAVNNDEVVAVYIKDLNPKRCLKISEEIMSLYGDELELKINTGINVDITAKNITKESAIMKIKDEFPNALIYTIGDSLNDIGMVSKYYGYAINSGSDQVKAVAKKCVNNVREAIEDIMEE